MTELLILICVLAVLFPFLKRIWNKQGLLTWKERSIGRKESEVTEKWLFGKLWIYPVLQFIFAGLLLFFMNMSNSMLSEMSSHSFLIGPALRENFGIFGPIASDLYEEYRSQKTGTYLSEALTLYDWGRYLLFATIATLATYALLLKERKIHKKILMGMNAIISVVFVYLVYKQSLTSSMGMNNVVSAEFFGLLGSNRTESIEEAVSLSATLSLVLIILFLQHYVLLNFYYDNDFNSVKANQKPVHEEPVQAPVADEGEKRLEELLNLKNLYESGILSKDEMESMKSNILGKHTSSNNVIIEDEVQTQPT